MTLVLLIYLARQNGAILKHGALDYVRTVLTNQPLLTYLGLELFQYLREDAIQILEDENVKSAIFSASKDAELCPLAVSVLS